ncbi:MAG TPA: hypothetical protein VEW25_11565 [Allosphingosinicella sp.]|nr:hypothetical protein [Allosphingosinicella sp.]
MDGLKQIGIDVDVNRVIEANRRSFDESENDILRGMLLRAPIRCPPTQDGGDHGDRETPAAPFEASLPGTRTTGRWTVELLGQRHAEPNLKAAYRKALLLLSASDPDFLAKFAAQGGRRRKFIARAPKDLFLSSPGLAEKHAAPLIDGWFFDTNLSTDQVSRRVRIAARLSGLHYGPQFRLLNNLQQI